MIVTFFGHAQILQREEIEKWLYVVTENLIEQGAITFYLGGYGAFDSLAASVLKAQKKGILFNLNRLCFYPSWFKPAVDSDILRLNICGCSAIEWDVTYFDNFVL